MFSSDEPWAMATMLISPAARAENTREAMPGVPAIPRPTTAMVAIPGCTRMLSTSRRAISSRKARSSASRGRLGLASRAR